MNGFLSPRRRYTQPQIPAPRVVPQPNSQVNRRIPLPIAVLLTPFNLLFRLMARSLRFLLHIFPILPRLIWPSALGSSPDPRPSSGSRNLNARETTARFLRQMEEIYGPNHLPFFKGSYSQAYDIAKRDLKFLIVVLVSSEHDGNDIFVRQILMAPETINFLQEYSQDLVLWGGSVQDGEAYQVSAALNCSNLPCTTIIAQHSSPTSTASMCIISRVSGSLSGTSYVASIRKTLNQHKPILTSAQNDRAARQATTSFRDEQNSAYERSLAADREKARIKREAETAEMQAKDEKLRQKHEALLRQENLKRWRQWRSKSIAPEPEQGAIGACRISIRMADGERVLRRFRSDLPIEEVYAYVECLEELQTKRANDHLDEKAAALDHEYSFRLVSPMPRTVFEIKSGESIGSTVGRSGNLIVEPLEDDDD